LILLFYNAPRAALTWWNKVMNPGMIPDGPILQTADKTVVFEERYQTYVNLQAAKQLAALPDRSALACLMHSIPPEMSVAQMKLIVNELRELAGSIFITELSNLYYSSFSPRFLEYVDAMV
jgi:Spherulation-specific family 4